MAKLVIGVTGFARSGKDTIAEFLVREHGFTRIGFGDPMREMLYAINPIISFKQTKMIDTDRTGNVLAHTTTTNETVVTEFIRLRDIIDKVGWNGYKETPHGQEIRELLQRLGTEGGRHVIGDHFWMDVIMGRICKAKGNVVISDVRFSDECDFIHNLGGEVIRVNRLGITAVNSHISDQQLPDDRIDFEVQNNRTIDDLELDIEAILSTQLGLAV